MAREQINGTRTVDCNYCGTDVETNRRVDKSICRDCIQEKASELLEEDRHEVECRECGEPTETAERFDSATCMDCHREAGRFPDATPSV